MTRELGREHITDAARTNEYAFCPPTSGKHLAVQNLGPITRNFYGAEREQNPAGWIHNLEHGYVVALYSCKNGCPSSAEIEALRRFFNEAPSDAKSQQCQVPNMVLVARFDQMQTRFALLGWDRALLTDTFDVEQAKTFAQQYMNAAYVPERSSC